MDPLSVTASIIAILQLSAKVLSYLNDVKDASKDRVACAVEASNLHNLLFNLRFRLEEGDPSRPWYIAVQALAVKHGPLDQFKQALEMLQAKMTDGGRLKKAGEALMWKFKKEEIAEVLARMERLKTLVEIALQMDHFKLSKAIKDDTSFVRAHVPIIQSGVDTIRQSQDSAKHRRLIEWLSTSDYPAQQSDIIKRRQEGTGQWFLDAPELAYWLNESNATLLCLGIPGAGKTMIAAIAIDHLLNTVQNSSHGVAYVYCNYKAREEQDVLSLLAAILKQLVQGRLSMVDHIERLYQKHANRGTKPSLDEVYSALRDVLAHYSSVHIVIDALDECQDATRRQFLAKLRNLQATQDIRLMATSRFIPNVEDAFGEAPRLEVQASREDVKRFVAGQTYQLPACIQRSIALQEIVQKKITDAVDGMFLLARLHTDSLLDKRTAKDVKTTLDKLTKGAAALDFAYREALQRIDGQLGGDRELAGKVLSWITLAERPLTTAEICCALAVEPGEDEIDPENVLTPGDLVSVCAGLVIIDEESAVIRLVHYTTQEYLERTGDVWNQGGQLNITTTCLTYLCFDTFQSGSCSTDKEFEARLQQNQFLDYAAKHLGSHAGRVETEVTDRTSSERGYEQVVKTLLDAGAEVNAQGGRYGNALQAASERGYEQVVKMLLDKGAEVNAQGRRYGNALYAASCRGHEQVVKMLLDKGAEVNAQGRGYGNALQAASAQGHEQVVKTLLDKGAEVNAQGGGYGNALEAASDGGHEQVVKMLLDKGAEVNAQGRGYGNALQAASYGGHEQVVKTLLDAGAEVVKTLLDAGADVNAQGGEYGNALQAASYRGHEQIVKMLLNSGAHQHQENNLASMPE
ncbi:ankyrin repeat domain containing protein [Pyrenophora tritici-repentis]|nr:ankyrin repeat domain containing protein [Pyrenophora tritici-repentis]